MATSVSTPASAPASAPATAIATSSPICNGNASDTFDAAIDTVPQTLPTTFTSNYNDADAQEDAFASSYAHSQSHFSGLYPWPLGNSSTAHHHRRSSCSTFESLTTATPGFMLADGADTDPANPFQFSLNGSGSLWNEADFATACIPPRPFSAPALSSSLLTQADDMNGWLSAAIAVDDSLLSRFATARRTDSCSSGSPPAVAAATVAADASTADLSMPPVSATIPAVSPLPAVNTTSFMAATAAAAATATATDTPVTSSATPWSNSLLCGGGGGTEVTAATTTTPTGSLTSMPLDSFEAVHAPLTAQQHQQQPQPQPQTQPQTLHSTPLSDLRHLGFGDYGYLAEEGVDQDSTGWKWPASFASAANSCGGTLDFSSSSVPWSSLASSVYASSQPSSSVVSSPASHSASLAVYESGGVNVEDYEPQQKEYDYPVASSALNTESDPYSFSQLYDPASTLATSRPQQQSASFGDQRRNAACYSLLSESTNSATTTAMPSFSRGVVPVDNSQFPLLTARQSPPPSATTDIAPRSAYGYGYDYGYDLGSQTQYDTRYDARYDHKNRDAYTPRLVLPPYTYGEAGLPSSLLNSDGGQRYQRRLGPVFPPSSYYSMYGYSQPMSTFDHRRWPRDRRGDQCQDAASNSLLPPATPHRERTTGRGGGGPPTPVRPIAQRPSGPAMITPTASKPATTRTSTAIAASSTPARARVKVEATDTTPDRLPSVPLLREHAPPSPPFRTMYGQDLGGIRAASTTKVKRRSSKSPQPRTPQARRARSKSAGGSSSATAAVNGGMRGNGNGVTGDLCTPLMADDELQRLIESADSQRLPKRAAIACTPCRQTKRKCDGGQPCSSCQRRKFPRGGPCEYVAPHARNTKSSSNGSGKSVKAAKHKTPTCLNLAGHRNLPVACKSIARNAHSHAQGHRGAPSPFSALSSSSSSSTPAHLTTANRGAVVLMPRNNYSIASASSTTTKTPTRYPCMSTIPRTRSMSRERLPAVVGATANQG